MRITSKFWAVLAMAAIVAMTSAAMAQRDEGKGGRGRREGGFGGPGGGRPLTMARLATAEEVQSALKLSDEQKDKVKKVNDDFRDKMQEMFQGGGPPDREKMQKMMEDTSTKLNDALDEGQRKRLMGIYIQVNGVGAVMDPAVAKELNITDEQRDKMREAFRGMRERGSDQGQASPEERRAKMDKELKSVLTEEQQKKLAAMEGEKVKVDVSKLRGPGGGRFGRGEGRGRGERGERGKAAESEKDAA